MVAALLLGNVGSSGSHPSSNPAGSGVALPPISVAPPPGNPAAAAPCTKLLGALPVNLNGLPSRPALSTSPYVVAWGDPAVVLRCGVDRPKGLVPGSDHFTAGINGVFYWVDPDKSKQTVFTVIDRAVYVEVEVPATYAGGPLAAVSDAVAKALPQVCVVDGSADDSRQCTHRP